MRGDISIFFAARRLGSSSTRFVAPVVVGLVCRTLGGNEYLLGSHVACYIRVQGLAMIHFWITKRNFLWNSRRCMEILVLIRTGTSSMNVDSSAFMNINIMSAPPVGLVQRASMACSYGSGDLYVIVERRVD
jgi:hypothetical protein